MWLFRRAFILWIALVLLCSAGVIVGRLQPRDNGLDKLGFELCGDNLCFRGISLNTAWSEAKTRLTEVSIGARGSHRVGMLINYQLLYINIRLQENIIHEFEVNRPLGDPMPITAADIIAKYGAPCYVRVMPYMKHPVIMELIYPQLWVWTDLLVHDNGSHYPTGIRFESKSPVLLFKVMTQNDLRNAAGEYCGDAPTPNSGRWRGFMSLNSYLVRFAQDAQ